jgi:hypothetical protein
MGVRQRGQRELGETMDRPSGMRVMQTFKKLPMIRPKRKKKKGITELNLTQSQERLNARRDAECRMANLGMEGKVDAESAEDAEFAEKTGIVPELKTLAVQEEGIGEAR